MSPDTERLDTLIADKYYIWQADDVLCYTMDSILAANFTQIRKHTRVLELGSGTGAISLICALRGAIRVVGVDIEPYLLDLFTRSINHNNLQDKVSAIQLDIKDIKALTQLGAFDLVIGNPPYRKANSGQTRADQAASAACHELSATLEDFIVAASRVLKTRGRLVLVNMAERLTDTITLMVQHGIEPKRLQFVHSKQQGPAKLFLIEGACDAQSGGLNILPPLIVYGSDGEYTEQLKEFYKTDNFI